MCELGPKNLGKEPLLMDVPEAHRQATHAISTATFLLVMTGEEMSVDSGVPSTCTAPLIMTLKLLTSLLQILFTTSMV